MSENIVDIKARLKKLLQENLDKSLEELNEILSDKSPLYDDFIVVSSRLKQHNREVLQGSVSKDDKDKFLSTIIVALLKIINEISSEDIINHSKKNITRNQATNSAETFSLSNENFNFTTTYQTYLKLKDWLEQNFKNFNYNFIDKKADELNQFLFFDDIGVKGARLQIFGSNLIINFTENELMELRYPDKTKNEDHFSKVHCRCVFDIMDIEEIKIDEEIIEGKYNKKLYLLIVICKDGLKKISGAEFTEVFEIYKNGKALEEDLDEEEESVEDFDEDNLSLGTTSLKFLEVFCKKMLEFKEICQKLN